MAQSTELTRSRVLSAWLFLLPMLIVLALVAGWPLGSTIYFSFTDARLNDLTDYNFIGLSNYFDPEYGLLVDPNWWRAVWNTFFFTIVSVSLETIFGLGVALLLNQAFAGRGILRAAVLIPWAIPTVVNAKMWGWMLNDSYGVVNDILMNIGLIAEPIAWTADPDFAIWAVILVDVWKTTPFMALLILTGLQLLPSDCYEAGKIDGVSPYKMFWRVSLPLIKPAVMVAVIFRALDALRIFDLIYVLTSNSEDTMSMSVFARQWLIDFAEVGYGSAASTLLFLIIAFLTIVYIVGGKVDLGGSGRNTGGSGGSWLLRGFGALLLVGALYVAWLGISDPAGTGTVIMGEVWKVFIAILLIALAIGIVLGFTALAISIPGALWIALIVVLVCSVFPFYYAIVTSFKVGSDLFVISYLPEALKWENYGAVFSGQPFGRNIVNSVIVSTVVVSISLFLGVTAAYALGRVQFRGRTVLLLTILGVSMFPQVAVLSGMFEMIRWLGLYNSLPGLMLANLILTLPFTVWILTTFMRELPKELEEAAFVDGATPWQLIVKVFLPLMGPAMVTTGLLAFIAAWNEFLFALTFTLSNEMRTVPVAIANFSGASQYESPWGAIMAASVIVTMPLIVMVLIFQRKIVAGLTAGAVKG